MSKTLVTESAEELAGIAEKDIVTVKLLIDKKFYPEDYMYNIICFHATQAVEKLLKGFIISNGKTVEKIHDLDILQESAMEIDISFAKIKSECMLLNTFAPNIKYSSQKIITKQDMDKIIKSMETICKFPPIKTMRDSFAKKHKYKIISKIITKPVSKATAQTPKSIKPNNAEKNGKKRKKT
jgi:HEPN domain-containing protein